ncbi:MAG: phosphatase PAP2 family protein [Actinobacteria bacterium]|nr:phosphatase PAP2 family protein [Actinomycetota bacterium]
MVRRSTVAAGAAVLGSYAALRSTHAQAWDRRAGVALSRPLGRVGDAVISSGTDLGSVYAIAGVSAVLAATGRRRAAVDVLGAGAVGWTVAQGVKPLVKRERPYQAHGAFRLVAEPAGDSWPSGHVAVAGAMAGALTPAMSPAARLGTFVLAMFVSVSRIYVGVHYLTDVVAGLGLGVLSARGWTAARRAVRRWRRR